MRNVKVLAFLAGALFSSPAFAEFEVKDTLSLNLQNVETAYICNASKAKFVLLESQYFNRIHLPTFRPSSARSDKLELKVMEFDTVLYPVDKPNLAVSNVGADDALWLFGDTGYYRAFDKLGSILILQSLGEPEERVECSFDKPESYVKKLDDFAWKYTSNTYQAYADSLTRVTSSNSKNSSLNLSCEEDHPTGDSTWHIQQEDGRAILVRDEKYIFENTYYKTTNEYYTYDSIAYRAHMRQLGYKLNRFFINRQSAKLYDFRETKIGAQIYPNNTAYNCEKISSSRFERALQAARNEEKKRYLEQEREIQETIDNQKF